MLSVCCHLLTHCMCLPLNRLKWCWNRLWSEEIKRTRMGQFLRAEPLLWIIIRAIRRELFCFFLRHTFLHISCFQCDRYNPWDMHAAVSYIVFFGYIMCSCRACNNYIFTGHACRESISSGEKTRLYFSNICLKILLSFGFKFSSSY